MRLGSVLGSLLSFRSTITLLTSGLAIAGATSACVVEHDHAPYYDDGYDSPTAASTGTDTGTDETDAGTTPGSVAPVKAIVDTGKTLNAAPGQGVGVFIEYASGGLWHVWWTCDTSTTNEPCAYAVEISSAVSPISAITLEQGATLASDADAGAGTGTAASPLVVTSNTSNTADGVHFATNAGATIRVDAQLGGAENGSILFFVQNGKVNGGYTGVLSDPLDVASSSP